VFVKEGRWDLDIELFKGKRIPISANFAQGVMKLFPMNTSRFKRSFKAIWSGD